MADISKCEGRWCQERDYCYRYTAPDGMRQSWMEFWREPKPCSAFVSSEGRVAAIRDGGHK